MNKILDHTDKLNLDLALEKVLNKISIFLRVRILDEEVDEVRGLVMLLDEERINSENYQPKCISAYDVFEMADNEMGIWKGNKHSLNVAFESYLSEGRIHPWVKQYCRNFLKNKGYSFI
jgi:hypothetical protein